MAVCAISGLVIAPSSQWVALASTGTGRSELPALVRIMPPYATSELRRVLLIRSALGGTIILLAVLRTSRSLLRSPGRDWGTSGVPDLEHTYANSEWIQVSIPVIAGLVENLSLNCAGAPIASGVGGASGGDGCALRQRPLARKRLANRSLEGSDNDTYRWCRLGKSPIRAATYLFYAQGKLGLSALLRSSFGPLGFHAL